MKWFQINTKEGKWLSILPSLQLSCGTLFERLWGSSAPWDAHHVAYWLPAGVTDGSAAYSHPIDPRPKDSHRSQGWWYRINSNLFILFVCALMKMLFLLCMWVYNFLLLLVYWFMWTLTCGWSISKCLCFTSLHLNLSQLEACVAAVYPKPLEEAMTCFCELLCVYPSSLCFKSCRNYDVCILVFMIVHQPLLWCQ